MNDEAPKQRALLYLLDSLPANTRVTLVTKGGSYFQGYISGVGEHDLLQLFDAPAAITPDSKSWVIDGCELAAYRVEDEVQE